MLPLRGRGSCVQDESGTLTLHELTESTVNTVRDEAKLLLVAHALWATSFSRKLCFVEIHTYS
ncbi:hypothetical protein I3843_08G119300 [Carya illinoinensis]|nr:hypothetical protein I3843_08G119300 [Carya illinoinensis]